MLHDEIASKLLDLELFRGLSVPRAHRVARTGERMIFRPGQTIISAGDTGEAAFLLVSGDVVVEGVGCEQPAVVPTGSLIGELAMLVEHTYASTVTCRGPARVVRFPRGALLAEMAHAPELAEHLVSRLSSRLTRVAVELRRIDEMLALAPEPLLLPAR